MKLLMVAGMLVVSLCTGYARPIEEKIPTVSFLEVKKLPDEKVRISMEIDIADLQVGPMHSCRLVPVFMSADGSERQELPAVVIDGKMRYRIHRRKEILEKNVWNPAKAQIIRNKDLRYVTYCTDTVFCPWMWGGKLKMKYYTTGCRECPEGEMHTTLAEEVLPLRIPVFERTLQTVPKEEVKHREEVHTARLQFRVNSADIDAGYDYNRKEIASLLKTFQTIQADSALTITEIGITGYSSPEGGAAYNLILSERRAKALADFLRQNFPEIDETLFRIDWKGEDWEGLRKVVQEQTDWKEGTRVLEIIDAEQEDRERCEYRLRLCGREIYHRIESELYRQIRRNEYRIRYRIRNFEPEEAWSLLHTRPEQLSLYEMQEVATYFGVHSKEALACWMTAVRIYPTQVEALNNAAILLAEQGRSEEALCLLEGKTEAMLKNVAGTIYVERKEWERAEKLFAEAAEAGNEEAKTNLLQLRAYRDYIVE